MLKEHKFLLAILILATILRFYKLGQIPPSLDWDEAAHGYNAYSILKTARDEYDYFLPLYFRSFDDYKPPIYTYLVVPSVAVFGLNDFAVRFPSAFLGVLAVLFTYLMTYELFKNKQIAILAAFFLAISPWHLQFSRVAFETNSAIFWSVLGTWAFLRGMRTENKKHITGWLSLAAIAFGTNLFMYHNARVFIPIYSMMLVFLFRKTLFKNLRYLVLPTIIALVYIAALIPILTSIAGQLRYKGTTIFADVSPQYTASELIAEDANSNRLTIGKIMHNRRLVYIPILIDNYLSHLKPSYLFQTADMDRHHAPQVGLLYLWDFPFILAGMYFLTAKKFDIKTKVIIFWWFLISPIASSVTWGVPHSLRSEIYLPTYQIFAAIGVFTIYQTIKHKKLFFVITGSLLLVNFFFYLHNYYFQMSQEFSKAWLYGRKEAALFTQSVKNEYDEVIVSTKIEQGFEFWLYYLKYDPKKYQQVGGTVSGGYFEAGNKFDKYTFKPFQYKSPEDEFEKSRTLYVGIPGEFPSVFESRILKKIYYLNGEAAIYIVK